MAKVCVVGGGTAGLEAAAEASARGAEVTVVEREERPDPPWRLWPDLIRALADAHGPPRPRWSPGGLRRASFLIAEAFRSGPGCVDSSRGRARSDAVILATGCSSEPPRFKGQRKPGVAVLDSARSYEELGRRSACVNRVVVSGEGFRCLEVAERLCGDGRGVDVFVSHWRLGRPSPHVYGVLSEAGRERGVSTSQGEVTSALGVGDLEAVLVNGAVVKCDALAFVPRRVPRRVPTAGRTGDAGGVLVDRCLRTDDPSTYAAGGCAELRGSVPAYTYGEEPSLSGRVAASNCTGGGLRLGPARSREFVLFGLRWSKWRSGSTSGIPKDRIVRLSRRWGKTSACEIVFDRLSTRVLEVEAVEDAARGTACAVPLSGQTTLSTLAYGGFGSSDISLVSDTARLGLVEW